jgi:serine/threonine-protein kinase
MQSAKDQARSLGGDGGIAVRDEAPPASAERVHFEPDELLGNKYVFQRVIAEGGMAVIVAAAHQSLGETVALKMLKPSMLRDKELVVRFAREAKATARVRSEYSVKILDVGIDARHGPFMVMEYLHGRDLRRLVEDEGVQNERRVAEIAIQACEALAAAHALGIVHRDVKPENIFITKQAQIDSIRLLDFGISKAALTGSVMNTDVSLVTTQMLLGSPIYMSPEQMRSSTHVDGRSDIWSLGVTMFEAISGRPPFQSETVTELCAMVLETQPPVLKNVAPQVSQAFSDVVMRCLRKDPGQRFQNVGELAVAMLPFAPSRTRMSVERIAAYFDTIGVRIEIPDFADQSGKMSIPVAVAAPVVLGHRDKTLPAIAARDSADRRSVWLTAIACVLLFVAAFVGATAVTPRGRAHTAPASTSR